MAFDFNNGNSSGSKGYSGGSPSPRGSGYSSGYGNSGSGSSNNGSGYGNSGSGSTSTGFNPPTRPDSPKEPEPVKPITPPNNRGCKSRERGKKGSRRANSSFSLSDIPWKIIIYVLIIAAAIAMLVIYQEQITMFIGQVLAWLIIIAVVVLAFRLIVFRKRR